MKAYTDIEQSNMLAEILPIESADLMFVRTTDLEGNEHYDIDFRNNQPLFEGDILCWSLAALLGVLPVSCDDGQHCLSLINSNPNEKTEWLCSYEDCKGDLILECYADNSIDACYEMILKLHELKML